MVKMSETKETNEDGKKKPLKLAQPGRLELKKTVESGQVKQSFSHGRSKTVAVEVKRKRTFKPGDGGRMTEVKAAGGAAAQLDGGGVADADTPAARRNLTESERAARERALEEARARTDDESTTGTADAVEATTAPETVADASPGASETLSAPATTEGIAEPAEPVEPAENLSAEELERRQIEDLEAKRQQEERARLEAEERARTAETQIARPADVDRTRKDVGEFTEEETGRGRGRGAAKSVPATKDRTRSRTSQPKRRSGKLTINQALDDESGERRHSVAALRRRQQREKQKIQGQFSADAERRIVREAVIPETITVGEFANRIAERSADVIRTLMKMDIMATVNQTIDQDTAEIVAEEMGHKIRRIAASDVEIGIGGEPDGDDGAKVSRAPVVTIMGHVDHGKTSLLDALRETDIVGGEAGGITQHIGAYQVQLKDGQRITFIDTPGHEAFTDMRQRGAEVTDIVVLVVAADDGVRPQTIEAINHARAAEVPLIVAINKMDRDGADSTKVKNELLSYEIIPEDLGGETQCVEVSAIKKTGLETLEEAILLQAEILELSANPDRQAYGTIIEAKLESGRGPVATVLVQRGTLRIGDIFIAGGESGRVRALINERGENVEEAGPSVPIEVLGLNGTPLAGQQFAVVDDEARAREIAEYRQGLVRDQRAAAGARGSLEQMFDRIAAGEAAEVPLVIKADVQGSAEAIIGALGKMGTEEVRANILHSAVGGITESDISLATASQGLIIGFNVRANAQAREQAKRDQTDIRYYSVIYDVVDDVKALMEGKLAPTVRENRLGAAEVREVFAVSKLGNVAGCLVTDGLVRRGAKVRLLRDDIVIHEGDLATLRRFKDDVREVQSGTECGMSFERYDNIQVGDVIECFEEEEIARTL
jgi:translation initiation factor IF-2